MKKVIVVLLFATGLASCKHGLTKSEESRIKIAIALQNATFGLNEQLRFTKDERRAIDSMNKARGYDSVKLSYYPPNDTALTFEKFMKYCEDNKRDPLEVVKELRTEKTK